MANNFYLIDNQATYYKLKKKSYLKSNKPK